jgi:hypothetical protein
VLVLREHLFIWSVFSPKLLFETLHTGVTAAACVLTIALSGCAELGTAAASFMARPAGGAVPVPLGGRPSMKQKAT